MLHSKYPYKPQGELVNEKDAFIKNIVHPIEEARGVPAAHRTPVDQELNLTPLHIQYNNLVKWARVRNSTTSDVLGWSPNLVLQMHKRQRSLLARLINVMNQAAWPNPHQDHLFTVAFRVMSLFTVPKPDGTPRPIGMPSLFRRHTGGIWAKAARPFVAKLCESRQQYGLSDERFTLAYTFAASWVVQLGGTVISNDKSNSFHEFHRNSILEAVKEAVQLALHEHNYEVADALRAILEFCFLDTSCTTYHDSCTDNHISNLFNRKGVDWIGFNRQKPQPLAGDHGICRNTAVSTDPCLPPVLSNSLVQGDAPSSLLEALVYAKANHDRGVRNPVGVIAPGAHDDAYIAAMPNTPIKHMQCPDQDNGSVMNRKKHIAVGSQATEAVSANAASGAEEYHKILGVPIGDVPAALRNWMIYFRQTTLQNLAELGTLQLHSQLVAMMRYSGPAGALQHQLRCIPPSDDILPILRQVDDLWITTWMDLAGVPKDIQLQRDVREHVRRMVFTRGAGGLGHQSAEENAELYYFRGVQKVTEPGTPLEI